MKHHTFGNFAAEPFLGDLAEYLKGQRVLEVFAGSGLLGSLLAQRGIAIRATSLFSGYDGHHYGLRYPVEEMRAALAVETYGDESDILIASWPDANEGMMLATAAWGTIKPIVYIGEISEPSGAFGLAGCASDSFFAATEIVHNFTSYVGRGYLDRAVVMKVRS